MDAQSFNCILSMTFPIATENIKLKYFLWKEKGKSSFWSGGPYALSKDCKK